MSESVWRKARKGWKCEAGPREKSALCVGWIVPGEVYMEYLGETHSSGQRYCAACAHESGLLPDEPYCEAV